MAHAIIGNCILQFSDKVSHASILHSSVETSWRGYTNSWLFGVAVQFQKIKVEKLRSNATQSSPIWIQLRYRKFEVLIALSTLLHLWCFLKILFQNLLWKFARTLLGLILFNFFNIFVCMACKIHNQFYIQKQKMSNIWQENYSRIYLIYTATC